MNKILNISTVIAVLTLISATSFADEDKVAVKLPTVEMKCYVSLLGGGEAIHFVKSKQTTLKGLANLLTGNVVFIPSVDKNKEIYRVKECIPLDDKFKNAIAKKLDSHTVR